MDTMLQNDLLRQDTLLRAMFQHATVGIVMTDEAGTIIRCNPCAAQMFGYEADELVSQQIEILIPDEFRTKHLGHRRAYHHNPAPRLMGVGRELFGKHKDGEQFPVEVSLSSVQEGEHTIVIAMVNDISRRVEKEKELIIKSEAIAFATIPICFADLDGYITYANSAFVKLWAFEKEEDVIGVPNTELGKSTDKVKDIMNALRTKGTWTGYDKARKADGTPFDIFLTASLVRNGSGAPICTIASFMDITELRQTQQVLEEKSHTLRTSMQIANLGSWHFDLSADTIFLDEQARLIFGRPANEEYLNYHDFISMFPPSEQQDIIDKLEQTIETQSACKKECAILIKNSTPRWISSEARALLNEEGKVVKVIGVSLDVTKQKEHEEQLKASEAKAKILFDYSAIIIWEEDFSGVKAYFKELKDQGVTDFREYFESAPDQVKKLAALVQITQINQESLKFYGVQSKEELITSISEWFIDGSWDVFKEELIALAEGHLTFESEIPIITPTGEYKQLFLRLSVPPQYVETWSTVLVSFIDITELKKNEGLLKEKEQELLEYSNHLEEKVAIRTKELAESQDKAVEAQEIAKLGYIEYNLVTNTIQGSKHLYEIIELDSAVPLTFEQCSGYCHPDDWDYLRAKIAEAKEQGKVLIAEFRIITAKGNVKHVFMKTSSITKDSDGNPVNRRGIIQDITTLKAMKIALRENQIKLEKALMKEQEVSELKSRFVSMASHEFRTPLTTILSSSNLVELHLQRGNIDKCQKHLSNIKSAVKNLTSILNDFLSLEKLESGKVQLNIEEIDLNEFMLDILEDMELLTTDDQTINYHHSGDQIAHIDQHLVRNIMINLLSNAIKYSPNGEDIDLYLDSSASSLIIRIKDRGIGIPADQQEQMFTRFFRASNASVIQGTGIGLTIVKRYLDMMQGSINFESNLNEGTTFVVEIPQ